MPLPVFTRTAQTCRCMPSQWNAWDADGQYYYLRYRSGRGSIETAGSEQDYLDNGPSSLVAAFTADDDEYVGEMSLEEFLELAGEAIGGGLTWEQFSASMQGVEDAYHNGLTGDRESGKLEP